jgi:hypothetical protein
MEYIDRRRQQIQRAVREEREQEHWNEVHEQLLTIQKKSLEVSAPDDANEKEADEVARKVMSGESAEIHGTGGTINRKGEGAFETTSEFQTKLASSKGNGQSLDDSTKSEMESKMGADLSGVKIHTGSESNEMNESVNAKAFTHGQDIYFGNSHSPQDKELLAHELVHTVQQGNGKVSRQIQRKEGDDDEKSIKVEIEFPFNAKAFGEVKLLGEIEVKSKGEEDETVGGFKFGEELEKALSIELGGSKTLGASISEKINLTWDSRKDPKDQVSGGSGDSFYWDVEYVPFQYDAKDGWGVNSLTVTYHCEVSTMDDLVRLGFADSAACVALIKAGYTINMSAGVEIELDFIDDVYKVASISYKNWKSKMKVRKIEKQAAKVEDLKSQKKGLNKQQEELRKAERRKYANEKGKNYDEMSNRKKKALDKEIANDKKLNPEKYKDYDKSMDDVDSKKDALKNEIKENEEKLKKLKKTKPEKKGLIKRIREKVEKKLERQMKKLDKYQRRLATKTERYLARKLEKIIGKKVAVWIAKTVAKVILRAIPIIGWILLIWDVVELLWEFRKEIWEGIKKLGRAIKEAVETIIEFFKDPVKFFKKLREQWEKMKEFFKRFKDFLKPWDGFPDLSPVDPNAQPGEGPHNKTGPGGNRTEGNGTNPNNTQTGVDPLNPGTETTTEPGTETTVESEKDLTVTPSTVPGDTKEGNTEDVTKSNGTDPKKAPEESVIEKAVEETVKEELPDIEKGKTKEVKEEPNEGTVINPEPGTLDSDKKNDPGKDPNNAGTVVPTDESKNKDVPAPDTKEKSDAKTTNDPGVNSNKEKTEVPSGKEVFEHGQVISYEPPTSNQVLNLRWHGATPLSPKNLKQGEKYRFTLVIHYVHEGVNRTARSSVANSFIFDQESAKRPGSYFFKVDEGFRVKTEVTTVYYAPGFLVRVWPQ